jgi:hypothetical protein
MFGVVFVSASATAVAMAYDIRSWDDLRSGLRKVGSDFGEHLRCRVDPWGKWLRATMRRVEPS